MNTEYEFKIFRLTRDGQGVNHRINKNAIHHIVTVLLPYYPFLGPMKSGERVDFIIYLFEKALKDKMEGYLTSWEMAAKENN